MKLHKHLSYVLIPAHLLLIVMLFFMHIPAMVIPVIICLWIIIGGIGVEIGLHRILSHRQFCVNVMVERLIYIIGTLGLNGSPLFWRSLHIGYHHAHTDRHRDYHSPSNGGFLHSYVLYINKLSNMQLVGCRDELQDKFHIFLHKYYILMIWAVLILSYIIHPLFCFSLLFAMILSYHQTASVNFLCHSNLVGYVSFITNNNSRNIRWLSYFTFGLSLHNNHHMHPSYANFAMGVGEYDVGYKLAKILGFKEI